jgi:hypothetical protein
MSNECNQQQAIDAVNGRNVLATRFCAASNEPLILSTEGICWLQGSMQLVIDAVNGRSVLAARLYAANLILGVLSCCVCEIR